MSPDFVKSEDGQIEIEGLGPTFKDYTTYKERDTDFLFHVQLFEDGALVRPASPDLHRFIEMITIEEFETRFDEFYGRNNNDN